MDSGLITSRGCHRPRLHDWAAAFLIGAAILAGCEVQGTAAAKGQSQIASAPHEGTRVGYLAPAFSAERLEGGATTLGEFRGKVVLLNFWATWCAPCRAEMPSLEELSHEFPSQEFVVVGVSADYEGAQIVKPFVESFGLTFPILLDPDLAVNDKFEIRGIPATILIDQGGIIRHKFFGAMNWGTPKNKGLIKTLIAGAQSPSPITPKNDSES